MLECGWRRVWAKAWGCSQPVGHCEVLVVAFAVEASFAAAHGSEVLGRGSFTRPAVRRAMREQQQVRVFPQRTAVRVRELLGKTDREIVDQGGAWLWISREAVGKREAALATLLQGR